MALKKSGKDIPLSKPTEIEDVYKLHSDIKFTNIYGIWRGRVLPCNYPENNKSQFEELAKNDIIQRLEEGKSLATQRIWYVKQMDMIFELLENQSKKSKKSTKKHKDYEINCATAFINLYILKKLKFINNYKDDECNCIIEPLELHKLYRENNYKYKSSSEKKILKSINAILDQEIQKREKYKHNIKFKKIFN